MLTLTTIIAGIIMLGILVFVHELGHFCVAKMAGVKILKFSLGFGPKLVSRQWGETEYMICAVPLGGYVQMLGEGGGEQGEEAPLTEEEARRSFAAQTVSRRTAIVAAGPLMNLLLPFLILPIAFMLGVQLPAFLDETPCIGYVVAESPGAQAGFEAGDCIAAINGETVKTWTETNRSLISHAGSALRFNVDREGRQIDIDMTAETETLEGLQSIGLLPRQDPVVGALAPGMPAEAAGLQVGDRIIAIDEKPVTSWYDLKRLIQDLEGMPGTFRVQRDGRELSYSIQAKKEETDGKGYFIGIAPLQASVFKRFGPLAAFQAGAERTWDLIKLTIVFIQKLFAGHVSAKSIGGPITVVQIAGQAAHDNLSSIFTVLAFLSIQLGILNLLPIPILDGGHLFFNLFEMIFRRPLSLKTREILQQIGLVLLILLMLLAFYNDIMRLFLGGQ